MKVRLPMMDSLFSLGHWLRMRSTPWVCIHSLTSSTSAHCESSTECHEVYSNRRRWYQCMLVTLQGASFKKENLLQSYLPQINNIDWEHFTEPLLDVCNVLLWRSCFQHLFKSVQLQAQSYSCTQQQCLWVQRVNGAPHNVHTNTMQSITVFLHLIFCFLILTDLLHPLFVFFVLHAH